METVKKYILTDATLKFEGHLLHRIQAVANFGNVQAGDLGGWIESQVNLSQYGDCWIYDEAKVYGHAHVGGNARVSEDAHVYENARVHGDAQVYGNANIGDEANVYGNAKVHNDVVVWGRANICGDAEVQAIEDYIVFKNSFSSGRWFTWTRSNNMWSVGCFYGTGKELIEKAYQDGKKQGDYYKLYVELVEKTKTM